MATGPVLRIVSINDVYALDQLPRFATLVKDARAGADAMIVVLAGDFLAPGLLSSLDHGRGMVETMNAVGITHVVLGNHEDDVPTEDLQLRLRELHAKCLGTNVSGGFEPPLPANDVLEVERAPVTIRVGLVGAVMDDANAYRRPPFGHAKLSSPNVTLLAESARLLASGCACVVPITHQTMAADRALANDASGGALAVPYPVILGGHEHVAIHETVASTQIVKTGADAHKVAIVDVTFDDAARPSAAVRIVPVADYAEDAAVRALVERHLAPVRQLESIPLVAIAEGRELSSIGTRHVQTSFGTFLCSNLRDALGAQGCLYNGGGIRGMRIHQGALTYGALRAEVPFDNAVVVVRLPGRVVRDAIAASRSRAPQEFGGYLQVDDRMAFDEHGVLAAIDGKPIDLDAEYRIASVHSLFGGLDRIEPLVDFATRHPELVPHADTGRETKLILLECLALARWRSLGAFSSIDSDQDGRATRSEIAAALVRDGRSPDVADAAAQVLLDNIDADRDGAISEDEGRRGS